MILFDVWAPSAQVFWQSWIDAGICSAPGVYRAPYAGCVETTADNPLTAWPGIVFREGVAVPGWHVNVRVGGVIEASFRAGCPDVGTIWETTHAAEAFSLTRQAADPVTGFPAGMRSSSGVVYADAAAFSTPSNVWA